MPSDADTDPREVPWHPRLRHELIGHERLERRLLQAIREGRLHHGLLLGGLAGVGKATMAYRLARFLLANGSTDAADLAIPAQHLVSHRVAARGHADLLVIERPVDPKTKKLKGKIGVEETRKVTHFFTHSAAEGGWRICIIDTADDLGTEAANALLKILEEPPAQALLILISSMPGRLLPTIRSRTLHLHFSPLSEAQVAQVVEDIRPDHGLPQAELAALAKLSSGSPGRALELMSSSGAQHFAAFRQNFAGRGLHLASRVELAGRFAPLGNDPDFDVFSELLTDWLAGTARSLALESETGSDHAARVAEIHQGFSRSIRLANGLNLDRRQMLSRVFEELENVRCEARGSRWPGNQSSI